MSGIENGQYKSFTQLDAECVVQQKLDSICNLYPAINNPYISKDTYPYPIFGRWGVQLQFPSQEPEGESIVIAQIGFNEMGNKVVITNSPQGINRVSLAGFGEATQKAVWEELRKGDFRDILLRGVVSVARRLKGLDVTSVLGVSAYNHCKVMENGGPLPFSTAVKSMDDLYERNGFVRVAGGDYNLAI